jgi:hypothetical protein
MIDAYVHIKSDYENVFAKCPHCCQEIIFNRVSDLKTTQPVGGLDVVCLRTECAKPFRIVGDSINEAHQMILQACDELLERKRYMQCVTRTCQAYEMFFNLHLYAELVYRPFAKVNDSAALLALNKRSDNLHAAIGKFAFTDMRNLSLAVAIEADHTRPFDTARAATFITSISKKPNEPSDATVSVIPGMGIANQFLRIKKSDINIERNKVAHGRAYRSKREGAEQLLHDAKCTLLPLTVALKLHSEITHY